MLSPARLAKPRKARAPARDHRAIAEQFEADVLAGRFPCGTMFRLAIERQRRDVANPPVGYHWKPELGEKACRFMDLLPCAEGPRRGEPLLWSPWQVWEFRTIFGWVDGVGLPRFRTIADWEPKGNGKSPKAAAVALYTEAVATGGEKSYSAATTAKQSRAVWSHAQEMLRLAPKIAERFRLEAGEHAIKGVGDNRVYEPVSAEAGSIEGIRPEGVVVLDEVHVLPNRKLYDNLRSAVAKCFTGRLVRISTAGFDMSPEALAHGLYLRDCKILTGEVKDETTFVLIAEADRVKPDGSPADPFAVETIRQANPNLDVSVSLAGILSEAESVRTQPSDRPSYEVKHLGWWQQTASVFLDVHRWNELGDPSLSLEDCDPNEWAVVLGIDLARTRDLTALVVLAVRAMPDGNREYRVFTRNVYIAENSPTLELDEFAQHKRWVKDNWITVLPKMTYGPLKAKAVEVAQKFGSVEACIDRWAASEVETDLEVGGITVVEVGQGAQSLSEPMKELEAAIIDGRIHHDGSPVAAMCIGNLQAKRDEGGNIKPTRENEYKKIDVAAALIDALYRGMVIDLPSPMSIDWV